MIYFFAFGTVLLIVLTWQDIKKKIVDARYNYMAHGIALSLVSHYEYSIIGVLSIIIGFMLIKKYIQKWIGKGDLTALHWILYGTFIINPFVTAGFALVFSVFTVVYGLLKMFYFGKRNFITPFYPVIISSFVLTGYMWIVGVF